jgi:ligand-binding sensor domain-containing protein
MQWAFNVYRYGWLVFLCFIFFIFPANVTAQTPVYKNYTVTDGIPGQTVYFIMQDSKGYLWVTTDAGVSHFDGIHFRNYTTNDGLTDNEVFHVFEDSRSRLWFITFNGKPCYYFNGKFYNPRNDSTLAKVKNIGPLHSFYEDSRRTIWLGSKKNDAIFIKENGEVGRLPSRDSMQENNPVYFYEPNDKCLWVRINGSFYSYADGKFSSLTLPDVYVMNGISFFNISKEKAIYISRRGIEMLDRGHNILIAKNPEEYVTEKSIELFYDRLQDHIWLTNTDSGAIQFKKGADSLYHITRCLLKEKSIMSAFCDNEKNTWLASAGNGIFNISLSNMNLHCYTAQDGLESLPVNCFCMDSRENMWLGYNNGIVDCIRKNRSVFKIDCTYNKKKDTRILGLETDEHDNVWVASGDGLLFIKALPDNKYARPEFIMYTGVNRYPVKSLTKDRHGIITITLSHGVGKIVRDHGTFFMNDYNSCFPYHRTYTHFFDHADNLWIGNINGLCLYTNDSMVSYGSQDPQLASRVFCIRESSDSTLILGTYGFGVLFFKHGKVINHLNEKGGLAGNICKKIFIKGDTVYIACIGGVTRFFYKNNTIGPIVNTTVSDGLLSNAVNDIMVMDGNMYISTSTGLNIIPCNFRNNPASPPPVYITMTGLNGQVIDTTKKVRFDYDRQFIRFNFIAPVFDAPENVVYSYSVSREDPNWVETKNSSVEFTSLAPGEYFFGVRARKGNSAWSKSSWRVFTITPPFWGTAWFKAAAVMLTTLGIYFVFYLRIQRIKNKAAEKTALERKIARFEMKALQAQMNPHFTFNVMNSIQNFIVNNDTTSALRYLSKFAKLIRIILENSQSSVIRLSEEVSALEIYLELEKMRFKEKFEYEIKIAEGINPQNIYIPSMLMQPYIENAIKHGILHKQGMGRISVSIGRNDGMFSCIIEDDGVGRMKAKAIKESNTERHVSLGSQISEHRVEAFNISYNSNIMVTVDDLVNEKQEGTGTRVTINIPV